MQQDRGPDSYGFSTEAPYRSVSSFEITMLDDGGRTLSLDMYEQNTISEINDNIDIACNDRERPREGRERSRASTATARIYAPGVTILSPNEPAAARAGATTRTGSSSSRPTARTRR